MLVSALGSIAAQHGMDAALLVSQCRRHLVGVAVFGASPAVHRLRDHRVDDSVGEQRRLHHARGAGRAGRRVFVFRRTPRTAGGNGTRSSAHPTLPRFDPVRAGAGGVGFAGGEGVAWSANGLRRGLLLQPTLLSLQIKQR